MCLTTAALNMFLALLPPELITREEARITVAAEVNTVVWERTEEHMWCSAEGYDGFERL